MTAEPTPLETPSAPTEERDRAWRLGYEDGILGQTWLEHRQILDYEAERERIEKSGVIEVKLAEVDAELDMSRDTVARAQVKFERLANQSRRADDDHHANPGSYGRVMGAVYFVFAAVLIVADYPLSKMIGTVMMNAPNDAPLWSDSGAVAAGIVVISLFFKLAADPFMRPRYLMPPWLAWMSWSISRIIGIALVIAVAASVAMLGAFRGQAVAVNRLDSSSGMRIFTEPAATPNGGAANGQVTAKSSPPGGDQQKATLDRLFDIEFLSRWAFITLGLMLPIIGGIFASAGAARFHNARYLAEATRAFAARQTEYEAALTHLHGKLAERAKLSREQSAIARTPTLADGQYRVYLHGYERGMCTPPDGSGVGASEGVQQFVMRWLAIAQQIQNRARTAEVALDRTVPPTSTPHVEEKA